MKLAALLAVALISTPALARTELDEVLENRPEATLTTSKSERALEYCIALALADGMTVSVIHGEDRALVVAWMMKLPFVVVTIRGNTVEIRGKGAFPKAGQKERVAACM